jgi:hypothetical protein
MRKMEARKKEQQQQKMVNMWLLHFPSTAI